MNAVNYSLNTLKHGAIGAAVGISHFTAKLLLVERFCGSIPFGLEDYVCLRSTTYFDIKKYTPILAPYIKLLDAIAYSLQLRLPFDPYNNHSIAYGFAEELLDRVLVQKAAFLGLDYLLSKIPTPQPKKLPRGLKARRIQQENTPGSIQKIRCLFSHSATRIFITTSLFAFTHITKGDRFLLPHVLSSLVYGVVFEKYGFIAAMTAHAIHNDFTHTYLNMQK
jgi:hypothetical protein